MEEGIRGPPAYLSRMRRLGDLVPIAGDHVGKPRAREDPLERGRERERGQIPCAADSEGGEGSNGAELAQRKIERGSEAHAELIGAGLSPPLASARWLGSRHPKEVLLDLVLGQGNP